MIRAWLGVRAARTRARDQRARRHAYLELRERRAGLVRVMPALDERPRLAAIGAMRALLLAVELRAEYDTAALSVRCLLASLMPARCAWRLVGIGYFHAERGLPFGATPNAERGSRFRCAVVRAMRPVCLAPAAAGKDRARQSCPHHPIGRRGVSPS